MDDLIQAFPRYYHQQLREAVPRVEFQLRLITEQLGTDVTLCDLGGGNGFFAVACVSKGMRATVIDDYRDFDIDYRPLWQTLESLGVEVIRSDFMKELPSFPEESLDVVSTIDCLEHLHSSPKSLLHHMKERLRPGGLFLIGVPN